MAQYGTGTVTVQSPNGLPVAQSWFVEQSAFTVSASFFDTTGAAFVPSQLRYRVDDILSQTNIVPWAGIPPSATPSVVITSQQNQMISQTLSSECHQILFQITDGAGNESYARAVFGILRAVGL